MKIYREALLTRLIISQMLLFVETLLTADAILFRKGQSDIGPVSRKNYRKIAIFFISIS